MAYWVMKSEPDCFSIDDLKNKPEGTAPWDGVRNYQVRNMFRDDFKVGDQAFFYHSSCEVPGIYGLMKVASTAYPDPTQFDPKADHYDPKSKKDEPRWLLVDVKFERKLKRAVTLAELRNDPALKNLKLLEPGSRLSVSPVSPQHWLHILELEKRPAP